MYCFVCWSHNIKLERTIESNSVCPDWHGYSIQFHEFFQGFLVPFSSYNLHPLEPAFFRYTFSGFEAIFDSLVGSVMASVLLKVMGL